MRRAGFQHPADKSAFLARSAPLACTVCVKTSYLLAVPVLVGRLHSTSDYRSTILRTSGVAGARPCAGAAGVPATPSFDWKTAANGSSNVMANGDIDGEQVTQERSNK